MRYVSQVDNNAQSPIGARYLLEWPLWKLLYQITVLRYLMFGRLLNVHPSAAPRIRSIPLPFNTSELGRYAITETPWYTL